MWKRVLLLGSLALTAPATVAQEEASCDRWEIDGFRSGVSFVEASQELEFNERLKFREPFGYRKFVAAKGRSSIDLHVDIQAEPPQVIGFTYSTPPLTWDELTERWGEPRHTEPKAQYLIHSWWDDTCEVSVRATTDRSRGNHVMALAVSSNPARSEYVRRQQEHKRALAEEQRKKRDAAAEPDSAEAADGD